MPLSSEAQAPRTKASADLRTVERYALRVGDLTVAVESVSPSLRLEIPRTSRLFLADDERPDLGLRVRWGRLDPEADDQLLFDSGGAWRLYGSRGRHAYRFFDRSFGPAPYKEARLDPDLANGEVFLNPDAFPLDTPVDALEFPLDELLFLRLLAARGGIELHACGVAASGQGYLFAGQSGDGKTTTARLWEGLPGASILSDDRIIVRCGTEGTWWMYGTPWHGEAELAASARAPLSAVLLLERGERNGFRKLEPAEAVSGLLARSFVPFHDADLMAASLQLLDNLVREVPCLRFPFVPEEEAVRFVLDSVPQGKKS
ncbi:MAG TPA: hypothetical protein VJU18_07735 [Vicinamibacteria bacterium]|nr:hypothetical protein [Vicinamibacteria bacterium]